MLSNRRRTLLGVFGVIALLTTLVLRQVLETVFFAITVAYVLFPIRERVVDRGASRAVAAATATITGLLVILVAIVPIFGALYVRREAFVQFVRDLPPTIVVEAFGLTYPLNVSVVLGTLQRGLTDLAVTIARAAPVLALKAALFVFLVYALLLRPHDVRAALLELIPTTYHDMVLEYHVRIRETLYAIYVLQVATALGTFLIAYPVFAILGYDSALTLAVFSGLLQFVPIVGPALVVLALGAYQVAIGSTAAAVLVVALGLVLVGFLPDAIIRPQLASFTDAMPGSLYFVGFVGGLLTVGVVGFIAGPLAVGLLLEASEQLSEDAGVTPTAE